MLSVHEIPLFRLMKLGTHQMLTAPLWPRKALPLKGEL